MYYRHYRHNPLFSSNPPRTISDIEDEGCLNITYFDTILKARSFLKQIECSEESQKNDPEMQKKIADACRIIDKANRRNTKRRLRRAHALISARPRMSSEQLADPDMQKRIAAAEKEIREAETNGAVKTMGGPRVCGTACAPKPREKKSQGVEIAAGASTNSVLPTWEEVLGPKGEVVRYKLKYHVEGPLKDQVKERTKPTKDTPKAGDIVMDLTCNWAREEPPTGIKAWEILANGQRKKIPVTKQMETSYKESNLYKVRQLAAGHITIDKFFESIKGKVVAAKKAMKRRKK
jgi:hypothetical protein